MNESIKGQNQSDYHTYSNVDDRQRKPAAFVDGVHRTINALEEVEQNLLELKHRLEPYSTQSSKPLDVGKPTLDTESYDKLSDMNKAFYMLDNQIDKLFILVKNMKDNFEG